MAAMKNLSDDEKAELLDTLSLPDDQLKQAKNRVSPVEEKSAEDNEKKKAELLKQLHELDKASGKSEKADPEAEKRKKEYLEHYDKKINEEQETYKKNQEKLLGESSQEKQDEKPRKKEYLFKMIFSLKKRHKNYLEERKNYSAKAKSSIRRIEEESGNKVKCVVDKNFIRAFRKLMGVGYR